MKTGEKYPQSNGWPIGWTDKKEKEYQRKESLRLTTNCPICGSILGHGHIIPYKNSYAHRRCVIDKK
jgi:hypothetical protein